MTDQQDNEALAPVLALAQKRLAGRKLRLAAREAMPFSAAAGDTVRAVDRPEIYRALIDRLVADCQTGQGQITARWVDEGRWPPPDDQAALALVERLDTREREVLAELLRSEFVSGVHSALVALHEAGIEPFDDGYEGSPFHDFVGRLHGWDWPQSAD